MNITDEELEQAIKDIEAIDGNVSFCPETILPILKELKDRRESDIRPATAFLHQDIRDLVDKIDEEINEVKAELYLKFSPMDKERISEELIDVQMAAETALTKIMPDIKDRIAKRREVIAKNDQRHYYNSAEGNVHQ